MLARGDINMWKRKRFAIVTEDGYNLGRGELDEEQVLQSMGYEVVDDSEQFFYDDSIKYEVIEHIRGKATDLTVFARYFFAGDKIEVTGFVRVRLSDTYLDFPLFSTDSLNQLIKALKRLRYRMDKIKRAERSMTFAERVSFFQSLNGKTISEIQQGCQLDTLQNENAPLNGDKIENKNFIGEQNPYYYNINRELTGGD